MRAHPRIELGGGRFAHAGDGAGAVQGGEQKVAVVELMEGAREVKVI